MIDIHSHILPGLDDGAEDMEESLVMAGQYEAAGYRAVVATPHWIPGTAWTHSVETVRKKIGLLREAIKGRGLELSVLAGMEVALDPELPALMQSGEVLSLAGKSYLLVEPPFQRMPVGWEGVFFSLSGAGFSVILAHAERCAQLVAEPSLYDELFNSGVFIQVNWNSFLGDYGRETVLACRYLAERGLIHCLATDCHDKEIRNPGVMEKAVPEVERLVGRENLEILARKNPKRIVRGIPLISMNKAGIPEKRGVKRLLSRLSRDRKQREK